uniref:Uncharacterized protein n=1 Tax=Opuntia streptacantha TaxID=393608 RepID=A0A7C9DF73_OPUST
MRTSLASVRSRWTPRVQAQTRDILKNNIGAVAHGALQRRKIELRQRLAGVRFRKHGGALPLESGVPVVLDGVVGATVEETSNGGPLVPEPGVGPDDGLVLVRGESAVLHLRGQLVAPPEPARLAGPTGNRLADQGPVPGAVFLDQAGQGLIFFGAPRTFYPIHFFPINGAFLRLIGRRIQLVLKGREGVEVLLYICTEEKTEKGRYLTDVRDRRSRKATKQGKKRDFRREKMYS